MYPVNFRDPATGEVVTFNPGDKLPVYAAGVLDDPRYGDYWTSMEDLSKRVAQRLAQGG